MSETVAAMSLGVRTLSSAGAYLELTKPRVVAMVLVTTLAGYYLGTNAAFDFHLAFVLLGATGLAAAGTMALNQYLERDLDAKMDRTRSRPLPQGRLSPESALIFGLVVTALGCALLWAWVNPLTALVTAAISIIYLLAYTPLKRVSPLCSVIGAVPGALPPVAGWAAARGTLGIEAWVLFAIMFLWQLPHSLAIAQLYRTDYARAGIRLLPTDDPDGNSTGRQIVSNSLALLAAAMLPTILGFAGVSYFIVAAVLGLLLLGSAIRLAVAPQTAGAARRVVLASLIYLPVLLLAMVLDKT
jgi:protoheme IX farnesyltransferase